MAGHSQFKNIMYRKGAQDKKRAKIFGRLIREITVAARVGLPEPDKNPRLRAAVSAARAANMPKDNIDRAIKRVAGGEDDTHYEEIRYEGYGPGGVALIVEALTDNRNRTASNVRSLFSKFGGNMAETGAVSFMFDRKGQVVYPPEAADADAVFEAAIEAGAEDVESGDDGHTIWCEATDLNEVSTALEAALGEAETTKLVWKPQTATEVDETSGATLMKLIAALDDDDDVQTVTANFDMSDEVMELLSA